jgi:hypothetical protein
MKKILIVLLVLGSFSTFAQVIRTYECVIQGEYRLTNGDLFDFSSGETVKLDLDRSTEYFPTRSLKGDVLGLRIYKTEGNTKTLVLLAPDNIIGTQSPIEWPSAKLVISNSAERKTTIISCSELI